ncbi:MAG: helix-turn-helix transcriptional regulator [bacterium]|nr:helix-turn-helix transcriptional regulator [bacterium]
MRIPVGQIAMFIFLAAVAVVMTAATYRLYQRRRSPYLLSFMFYLGAWYISGLLSMIYIVIFPQVLPPGVVDTAMLINTLLFIPLHGLIAYFFLDFIARIFGKTLPGSFKIGFSLFFFIFFIYLLVKNISLLIRPMENTSLYLFPFTLIVMAVSILSGLVYLFLRLPTLAGALERRYFFIFGVISTVGFILSGVAMFSGSNQLTGVVVFGFNIPAFLILRAIPGSTRETQPVEPVEGAGQSRVNMEGFCTKYGISPREREIITLVTGGKSNREIEEELFVSLDTVKKHIYNIYKKTGVKSRIQLSNLLQSFGKMPP